MTDTGSLKKHTTNPDRLLSYTPRVVILGSGYAGMAAARQLLKDSKHDEIEVVMVSNVDHLLYVTMIYEVAAGNLPASGIRQSVRTTLQSDAFSFTQGRVKRVDFDNQTIQYLPPDARTQDAEDNRQLTMSYDYLISAIGSETSFFGTPGAKQHAKTLKTLGDAKAIKNTIINHFERAALETNAKKVRSLLRFVVVGGGPSGSTLSAKVADLLNNEMRQSFPALWKKVEVVIVEGTNTLVKPAGEWFSKKVSSALKKKGNVRVILNTFVKEVRADGVDTGDEFIPADTVVWTAGVKAREFEIQAADQVRVDERSRRLHVEPTLQIQSYPNTFVAGDQAWVERIDAEEPYPMRAQFAVRQGRQSARNVLSLIRDESLSNFSWDDKGLVISLGHKHTYADVFGMKLTGFLATLVYKLVYLKSMIGFRARARATLEWTLNTFLPRDVSEL